LNVTLQWNSLGEGILRTIKMSPQKIKYPSLLLLFGFFLLLPSLNSSSTKPPIPGEGEDTEPDQNCRCPFNIEPQISLCGYEMVEMNRRAKRKVRQTTCVKNQVYDCSRGNSASNLIQLCQAGTKCSIGSEALSKAHGRLIMADPDHRWCLNETGLSNSSTKPAPNIYPYFFD